MPGAFALMLAMVFVAFPMLALTPTIMAAWKRRYPLAVALLLVGVAASGLPWLLMNYPGVGHSLGMLALPLFFMPVWFGLGASLVVLFTRRMSSDRGATEEGPVAPWLQEMRKGREDHAG